MTHDHEGYGRSRSAVSKLVSYRCKKIKIKLWISRITQNWSRGDRVWKLHGSVVTVLSVLRWNKRGCANWHLYTAYT